MTTYPLLYKEPDLIDIIRDRRGWSPKYFRELTTTPPAHLDGIDDTVAMLHEVIEGDKEITIITDFDMDGVSSGIVAYAGLSELGAHVNLVVPDYHDPRNMGEWAIDKALSFYPDTDLFITCDGGINANIAIDYAQNDKNIPVLVTDHHQEAPAGCHAQYILNPNRINTTYPYSGICGAQVIYLALQRYTQLYTPQKKNAIELLEMFAGIGALADVMPLKTITRGMVKHSLSLLQLALPAVPAGKWGNFDHYKATSTDISTAPLWSIIAAEDHHPVYNRAFQGLILLMRQLIAHKKIVSSTIDASFIGFTIAPMFNATRRVEGDMRDTFAIFTPKAVQEQYPDFDINAVKSIDTVIANNEKRKALVKEALADLFDSAQPHAPFIYLCSAPAGVLGLIATALVKESGLPTIVLNPQTLSGSARAPEWANILDIAADTPGDTITAQGHPQACGVNLTTPADLDTLYYALYDHTAAVPEEDKSSALPDLHLTHPLSTTENTVLTESNLPVDARMDDTQSLKNLYTQLEYLAPFGHGFEYPTIKITFRPEECAITTMGTSKQHIKVVTPTNMTFLWWNAAEKYDNLSAAQLATATVQLGINYFKGEELAQGVVRDMTLHEPDKFTHPAPLPRDIINQLPGEETHITV